MTGHDSDDDGSLTNDGWDDDPPNLAGLYKEQPSVLRYILQRGISDRGGNPYDGVSAYDPTEDLQEVQDQFSDFKDAITAISPITDVGDYFTTSVGAAGTVVEELDVGTLFSTALSAARMLSNSTILQALETASQADRGEIVERALEGFRSRARAEYHRNLNRFTGPMADLGAVNSSAYVVGLAMLEKNYQESMQARDAEFTLGMVKDSFAQFMNAFLNSLQWYVNGKIQTKLQEEAHTLAYVDSSSKLMFDAVRTKLEAERQTAVLKSEINRQQIVAFSEQYEKDLEYDVKNIHWDLELFQLGANVISALQGSVVTQAGKPSRFQSALGGAMSGAGAGGGLGATIGAAFGNPVVGGAIGVGIGGIVGLIAGAQ
jgi:hypothetical protein